MIAALRDIWHMAKRKGFARSYQDAYQLLINSGRYVLAAGINEPVMVRPLPPPVARASTSNQLGVPQCQPALQPDWP